MSARTNRGNCKSCGAAIEWALTENGKRIPIDVDRRRDGCIVLSHRRVGEPAVAVYQSGKQLALLARQAQARGETLELFVPHACPNAPAHRKPKAAAA